MRLAVSSFLLTRAESILLVRSQEKQKTDFQRYLKFHYSPRFGEMSILRRARFPVLFMPFAIGKISRPALAPFHLFSFSPAVPMCVWTNRAITPRSVICSENYILADARSRSISPLWLCISFRYLTKNQRRSKRRLDRFVTLAIIRPMADTPNECTNLCTKFTRCEIGA